MTAEGIALIVAAVGAVITPITVAWLGSRAAKTAETVRHDLDTKHIENSAQLDAIRDQGAHTQSIVNSERDRLMARLETLHAEVQRLHAIIEQAAGHAQGVADQKQADRTAFKPEP